MSSNSSNDYADYLSYLAQLSNNINYLSTILPSIGIPFNLISVFIFWRLRKNKSNMVFLSIFQSIFDTILLLLVLLVFRSQFTIKVSFTNQSDGICKFLAFLKRYIYIASSWMQVLITFDRVIFVLTRYENRLKFMTNKLNLTALILALLFILALFNVPNFFFYVDANFLCTSSDAIDATTDAIAIILRTYLPFLLMIIFNFMMVNKIFKNSRNKFNNQQTALSRREFQLTFSVMAFDVYFFLVNFPVSLYFIFSDVNMYSDAFANNPILVAQYSVFSAITSNFSFFQQTFSFFMYMIFNKLFRSEVYILIGILLRVKKPNAVQ